MKIAVLSNVNLEPVNRLLMRIEDIEVFETEGYGNELGVLLNRESALYTFNPEIIFLFIDVMELIGHELDLQIAESKIGEWFELFENSLQGNIIYYVSDAYVYGTEMGVIWDRCLKLSIEYVWMKKLKKTLENHSGIRCFYYSEMVNRIGEENTFSKKMWYMGRVLHSLDFHKILVKEIEHRINLETKVCKKVLLLDLDNTLWRGLAGEHDNVPIMLSDDGIGLAYKNFQRVLKQMQLQGVVLGVVSKNNKDDAMDIIINHPHMILREKDFSVIKINWKNKNENIVEIANELNIGMESIVFVDDNPLEQALVKETLPEVVVPEFPSRPEELTSFMSSIYHEFFEKPVITQEDANKTEQYQKNRERKNLLEKSIDFDSYLNNLDMNLIRVSPEEYKERFVQLVNKTNQFNLTTRRFSEQQVSEIIQNKDEDVFLYRLTDKFGDNGIVVAAIVEFGNEARISEFTMSCRVMNRQIENAVIEDMENAARERGYQVLFAAYKPSKKNKPVESLYPSLGYKRNKKLVDGSIEYLIQLEQPLTRKYHLTRGVENARKNYCDY